MSDAPRYCDGTEAKVGDVVVRSREHQTGFWLEGDKSFVVAKVIGSGTIVFTEHAKAPWFSDRFTLVQRSADSPAPDQSSITNPEHYRKMSPEPIDVILSWDLDYLVGSAVEYIGRYRYKGTPIDDLRKAADYLLRKAAIMESECE